jgi:hypothetical protein
MPAGAPVGLRLKQFKAMFFTSPAVIQAVDKATHRALMRFGQYVRKVARHSIKSAPGPSQPGQPPHGHIGLLKGHIYYGFDPGQRSVVIGPALLGRSPYGETTIPEVLEEGGTVTHRSGGPEREHPERPFMGPAFGAGQEKLDDFWRDSIK